MRHLRAGILTVLALTILLTAQTALGFNMHIHTMMMVVCALLIIALAALLVDYRRERRERFAYKRNIAVLDNRLGAVSEEAQVFGRISRLIEVFNQSRDLDAVLDEAAEGIREALVADAVILHLYSTGEGHFFRCIEKGARSVELDEAVFQDAMVRQRSILANDLSEAPAFRKLSAQGFTALAAVPLFHRRADGAREAVGLVAAFRRLGSSNDSRERTMDGSLYGGDASSPNPRFSSRQLSLLEAFTQHAALVIENTELYERTAHMARHDGLLTNLANRRRFEEVLERELAGARRRGAPIALIMIDIDHFKMYNDRHGHLAGDLLLQKVADLLVARVRRSDAVSRYGGEEFAVILPDTHLSGARSVGEDLCTAIAGANLPYAEHQPTGALTITLGAACFPEDASDRTELIHRADQALYHGKHAGRNRLVCYRDVADEIRRTNAPDESSA